VSRTKQVCETSHAIVAEKFHRLPESQRNMLCFSAVYMYELLTFGLHFPPHTNDPNYQQSSKDEAESLASGLIPHRHDEDNEEEELFVYPKTGDDDEGRVS
jgi:hypothetical protein